jgi:ribosomal protein L37AE/L43A
MGRKTRNCDKDQTLVDKLKRENARLKRDYAKLRKQVDRLNLEHERYRTLRELVHKQTQEARESKKKKQERVCWDCGKGTLDIMVLRIPGSPKYIRICNVCGKKTKAKAYTPEVDGYVPEEDND